MASNPPSPSKTPTDVNQTGVGSAGEEAKAGSAPTMPFRKRDLEKSQTNPVSSDSKKPNLGQNEADDSENEADDGENDDQQPTNVKGEDIAPPLNDKDERMDEDDSDSDKVTVSQKVIKQYLDEIARLEKENAQYKHFLGRYSVKLNSLEGPTKQTLTAIQTILNWFKKQPMVGKSTESASQPDATPPSNRPLFDLWSPLFRAHQSLGKVVDSGVFNTGLSTSEDGNSKEAVIKEIQETINQQVEKSMEAGFDRFLQSLDVTISEAFGPDLLLQVLMEAFEAKQRKDKK